MDAELGSYDHNLFNRLAWRFYLVSLASITAFAVLWYQTDCYIEREKWKKEELSSVYWPSIELSSHYHEALNDLLGIASQKELFLDASMNNRRLIDEFSRIARHRRSYYRIAFIKPDGVESVGVNFIDGYPAPISPQQLKSRRDAAFFIKSIKLGEGEVYMSRFEMSDDGEDALARKRPVILLAMPVFDTRGDKKGVLVVNSLGDEILEHIGIHDDISDNRLFLVNDKGRLLYNSFSSSANPDTRNSFNDIYPIWEWLDARESGQFLYRGSLVTFRQVKVPERARVAAGESYTGVDNLTLHTDEKPWKIVSLVEPGVLVAGANRRIKYVLGFLGVLLIVMIPVSRSWANSRVSGAADGERIKTFAQIIEQSDELVYVTDVEGNICYANYSLLSELERIEISGIQTLQGRPTIVGMSVDDVWAAFPEMLSDIKRALTRDDFFVVRYINGRGFRIHYSPLKNIDGGTWGVVCVATDISERLFAEKCLERSEKRLSDLASHIESVREEERATIARDLHDELGSTLTGLKMDVGLAEKGLAPVVGDDVDSYFGPIKKGLDSAIKRVRQVTTRLHPQMLSDLGLYAALEWQVDEFRNRSGLAVDFEVRCDYEIVSRMSYSRSVAVYRIVQECLTNILRHANAASVVVELDACQTDRLVVVIADDGDGASNEQLFEKQTFGVLGMQERARHLGGRLDVESGIGLGTRISLTVPLVDEEVNGSSDR